MKEIKTSIKFKVVEITPEDAQRLLESSKGNRPVTRKRILQYAAVMGLGLKWSSYYSSWITLDSGKTRSGGDVFGIEGITNPILKNAIVNKYYGLVKGMTIASEGGSMHKLGLDFKGGALEIYHKHPEVFDWAASISSKAVDRGLKGICVASILGGIASYLVLEKGREKELVERFFESLVSSFSPLFVSTRTRLKGTSKGVER